MYDTDMPKLAAHGLKSPEGFADVVTFVLLTIQQPLNSVAGAFKDVRERGARSRFLFGAKRSGYRYIQDHKAALFARVKAAIEARDTVAGIDALLDVPSLGLVKAAFVMQCLGATDAACIDTHNLARFGLSENAVKFRKAAVRRRDTRLRKIRAYIDLCAREGNARYWWNSWCDYVATKARSSGFASAEACSREHCRAIGLA